ncbi:hypothetical protein DFJ74DRAFT_675015 [Hyaloraphidium curvatum]|nr:hypothetical protein DFJ74DRAFT_675015 [Hyaloraphidium curvatum]
MPAEQACQICSFRKKRCERKGRAGCARCRRLGLVCEAQVGDGVPRRAREAAQRAAKEAAGADVESSPPMPAGEALPVVSIPVAPAESPAPHNIVLAGLTGFFGAANVLRPLVHKPAFEAALGGGPSPWGRTPSALLLAMAAHGLAFGPRAAPAPALRSATLALVARSRDALLAGTPSDLEVAQTGFIMFVTVAAALEHVACRPLFDAAIRIASAAVRARPRVPDADPAAWLASEMMTRVLLVSSAVDGALALVSGRPRYSCDAAYGERLTLPVSEARFTLPVDARDGSGGLATTPSLSGSLSGTPFMQHSAVDPSPARAPQIAPAMSFPAVVTLRAATPTPEIPGPVVSLAQKSASFARELVSGCVAPIFDGRASSLALHLLGHAVLETRCAMRALVRDRDVDPIRVAVQDASLDSPLEAEFRARAAVLDAIADALPRSLPQSVGDALADGDPLPLIAAHQTWFQDVPQCLAFLDPYVHIFVLCTGAHFTSAGPELGPISAPADRDNGPLAPSGAFLASDAFVTTLARALIASRLLSALRRADPSFDMLSELCTLTATTVAGVQLAAARMCVAAGLPTAAGWAAGALETADFAVAFEESRFLNPGKKAPRPRSSSSLTYFPLCSQNAMFPGATARPSPKRCSRPRRRTARPCRTSPLRGWGTWFWLGRRCCTRGWRGGCGRCRLRRADESGDAVVTGAPRRERVRGQQHVRVKAIYCY